MQPHAALGNGLAGVILVDYTANPQIVHSLQETVGVVMHFFESLGGVLATKVKEMVDASGMKVGIICSVRYG